MRQLRPYQLEACEAVHAEWVAGTNRTAVILPTGAGKTDVIAKIATDEARAGGRVLVMAHRSELLDQVTERCQMHDSGIPVGRVQANRNTHRRPIVAAMVQTMAGEKRQRQMLKPSLVIVDEAHHAASPSYMQVLTWAGSFDGTRTMGMTATMARGDRRGLGDVWSSVAYQKSMQWAFGAGWLVEPRGLAVVTEHMDLEHAKIAKGDYVDSELAEMVSQDTAEIVKAWQSHASERPTIAFTPNVQSATDLCDEFLAAGVAAELVVGETEHPDRRDIYARVTSGETRVLVNVMVGTEGLDLPALSCALIARPTRSAPLYQQMIGRVLRPHLGKVGALVLDVVGASRTQRLVTLIDLHETAEYDSSELPPCEDCQCKPCVCPKERDPNGGRRLLRPEETRYEDVELFSSSSLNWLFTRGGTRFVPAGDRIAAIWAEPDGSFSVGHGTKRGPTDGQWLGGLASRYENRLTLEQAFTIAEAWALAYDPSAARRDSPWRRKQRPSEEQISYARRLGIPAPETMNKARISDEISIALASARLDHVQ